MPNDHSIPPSALVEAGAMIGPYRIASVVADGPSGTVYEAVESGSGRRVALRHLPGRFVNDIAAQERFLHAAGKGLQHANVVAAEGAERHGEDLFLVTEFVGGRTAGAAATRMAWRVATRLIRDAARGLAAIHNAGLVHGEVTPRHLIVTHDGGAKLVDLGLAGLDETPVNPECAAPELIRGHAPDARTDLYALGATYFTLLTGRPPFAEAGNPIDVYDAILHGPVPTVRAGTPDTPLRCDVIVQKAMAKDPDDRYPSAETFLTDLDALLADDQPRRLPVPKPPPQRFAWRRAVILFSGLIVLAALAGAWYVYGSKFSSLTDRPKSRPVESTLPTVTNTIGMVLARIPAGRFLMGDESIFDARPSHPVQITKPFLIGVATVKQSEYKQVVGNNPSEFSGGGRPVENVTWDEAVAFCQRLSERAGEQAAGRIYRLPTEAEWEYACRAGTRTSFSLGPRLPPDMANTKRSALEATTEAATFPANTAGLYDVHGNVWQWCSDWYGIDSYASSKAIDPTGPREGRWRVARGGSWDTDPADCRSASRKRFAPDIRSPTIGFRVVCTVDEN